MATHTCDDPSVYCHRKFRPSIVSDYWFHELTAVFNILNYFYLGKYFLADPGARSLRRRSLPLGCWDRGFESRWRNGCLFCFYMLCCPVSVEAFATSWSLVQRIPTACLIRFRNPKMASGNVDRCSNPKIFYCSLSNGNMFYYCFGISNLMVAPPNGRDWTR
jgi:hypothetical protein